MKLLKYYPFLAGLMGFPIQVIIGNLFDYLYFKAIYAKPIQLILIGAICKFGEYKQSILPYLILSALLIPLIFLVSVLISNKVVHYFSVSYFSFLSFALVIFPLPNLDATYLLKALFLSSSYLQFVSHYFLHHPYLFYLIPLIAAIYLLYKMKLTRFELRLFLMGSCMSVLLPFMLLYAWRLMM